MSERLSAPQRSANPGKQRKTDRLGTSARLMAVALALLAVAACSSKRGPDELVGYELPKVEMAGAQGVNPFLWRAALDTLSFMPLTSTDAEGGVIVSDWFFDPAVPDERFKVTVYVLDRNLRADGLRVTVFRQTLTKENGWAPASVKASTVAKLEDAILDRARQLRIGMIVRK
jgi:hypothetical protein